MAKLKVDSIEEKDLLEYLATYSDFSFELRILKMLRDNGLDCEHAGRYTDPVTGKSREFDIRAVKQLGAYRIRLAVECKNIRANFPVLISCVPRHPSESYHEVACLYDSGRPLWAAAMRSRATVLRIADGCSLYKPGHVVGKSIAQVGRLHDNDTIQANDNELFDKWSQALNSADDLVSRMYSDGSDKIGKTFFSTVMPIVVIPDGMLWAVHYDADGNMSSGPSQTTRCPYFIGKTYKINALPSVYFDISHIEIMTYGGLYEFVTSVVDSIDNIMVDIFSEDGLDKELGKHLSK